MHICCSFLLWQSLMHFLLSMLSTKTTRSLAFLIKFNWVCRSKNMFFFPYLNLMRKLSFILSLQNYFNLVISNFIFWITRHIGTLLLEDHLFLFIILNCFIHFVPFTGIVWRVLISFWTFNFCRTWSQCRLRIRFRSILDIRSILQGFQIRVIKNTCSPFGVLTRLTWWSVFSCSRQDIVLTAFWDERQIHWNFIEATFKLLIDSMLSIFGKIVIFTVWFLYQFKSTIVLSYIVVNLVNVRLITTC